jgi:hypothetical protein
MQYDVIASESWGTYWTTGQVHVDGVCTIEAPTTARLRFMELDNLSIETTVSPDVISAGAAQTFTYTVEVANSSSTAMTLRWIRHYMDDGFDYLPGTTSGSSVADPDIWWNPVAGRYTHEWAFGGAPIPAYSNVTISFDVSAALLPGVYTARSSVKVEEDQGSVHKFHDLSSFETGETAPITARRAYSITASQGGVAIDVEALLLSSGVEILSWLGS